MITLYTGIYAVLKSRVGPYLCLGLIALTLTLVIHHDQTRLAAMRGDLNAAQASLAATQAQLAGTQQAVANTNAALAAYVTATQYRDQVVTTVTAQITHTAPKDDGTVAPVLAETLADIAAAQSVQTSK